MTRRSNEGMTLIEVVIVVVIIALGASGLTFSMGALTKATLRGGAGKLAGAVRYAYNRAVVQGTTVRIAFAVPGNTFSLEEANSRVTLARANDERRQGGDDDEGNSVVAADPWEAARARMSEALKPNLGASPFRALATSDGKALTRYQNIALGRRVQIVRLIVPHHLEPVESGQGAVHFFSGGMTEHAVIHLSDGSDAVYSVEIHGLTGRVKIRAEAYEPEDLLGGEPGEPEPSEVE